MISSCYIFNPSHMSVCEQRLSVFWGKSGIIRATLSVFSALLLNNIDLFSYWPTYVVSLGPGYNVRSLSDHRTTICDFCRWSIDILTFEIFKNKCWPGYINGCRKSTEGRQFLWANLTNSLMDDRPYTYSVKHQPTVHRSIAGDQADDPMLETYWG